MKIDFSKCFVKCEGMDIISYNEYEIPSKLSKMVSPVYKELHKSKFEKYQTLNRYISKLSDQYNNYKEVNHSHTKSKLSFFLKLKVVVLFYFRFQVCLKTSLCKNNFWHTKVWKDYKRQSSQVCRYALCYWWNNGTTDRIFYY